MDFDLSADQLALREAAGALLEGRATDEDLRRRVGSGTVVGTLGGAAVAAGEGASATAARGYDDELWAAMAEQGWPAVEQPEAEGGLGLGMVEVAVLSEQVGRHVAPAPFLETVLAAGALRGAQDGTADADALREGEPLAGSLLRLTSGEAVGTVAWCGEGQVAASAESDGTVRLEGRTDPLVYGPSAEVVVLALSDGLYATVVNEGRRPAPEPAMDRTRELGWLRLEGDRAWRIGDRRAAERLVDRAATGVSAEMLGAAESALERSVAYAKERVQFGKPIGSFQAIKHKLADALVDVEGMRSTVYYAAWCSSVDHPDAALAASMAKAWCSDASTRVMAACLQVHGGIGFTWEHPLHLYLKRAQLDQVSFGDAAWHRDRLSEILRGRLAEGAALF